MNDNGLTAKDLQLAEAKYRELITKHVGEKENLALIKADFHAWYSATYTQKTFTTTTEKLLEAALWQDVNGKAGRRTPQVLEEIESGQISLQVEDWLEQAMTVGKHRRILIKHYKPDDGALIIAERTKHFNEAKQALANIKRQVKMLDALVKKHGSVNKAAESGAFLFGDSEQAAS